MDIKDGLETAMYDSSAVMCCRYRAQLSQPYKRMERWKCRDGLVDCHFGVDSEIPIQKDMFGKTSKGC